MGYSIDDRRYWDRKAEQDKADAKFGAEYAETSTAKRQSIYKQIQALSADQTDSGIDHSAKIAALRVEMQVLDNADAAQIRATWTREQTIARRAEWNTWVRANRSTTLMVRRQEQAQGYTVDKLKAAIKAYNL